MRKLWRDMAFVQSYFLDYSLKASSAWIFPAIPDSAAVFVFGAHRLNISIPQAAVNPRIRGYVSPTVG
jgi:outer membrane usher protein FimD/PapC